MGISEAMQSKLYREDGNTIAEYVRCIGVPFSEERTIPGFSAEFFEHSKKNYQKILLMLREENKSYLSDMLADLEYLNKLFSKVFLADMNDATTIIVNRMHSSGVKLSIGSIKYALSAFEIATMKRVRELPSTYFDLLSSASNTQYNNSLESELVQPKSLPIAKLSRCTFVERMVLLKGDKLIMCGPVPSEVPHAFFYTDTNSLTVLQVQLMNGIKRSRTSKQTKLDNAKVLNELLTRGKLKPLDVLVLPEFVTGSLLRGTLTVKFKVAFESYEDNISIDNLVYAQDTLKVYKSNISLSTPLGKRDIYLAYYAV